LPPKGAKIKQPKRLDNLRISGYNICVSDDDSVDDGDKKNRLSNKENSRHIYKSRGTFIYLCFSDKGVMNLCQFFYTLFFAPEGGKKEFFDFIDYGDNMSYNVITLTTLR